MSDHIKISDCNCHIKDTKACPVHYRKPVRTTCCPYGDNPECPCQFNAEPGQIIPIKHIKHDPRDTCRDPDCVACHPPKALHPFFEELHIIGEIFSKKNKDYSGKDDEYGNLRACERLGIPAWKGVIIRLQDKFTRLENGFRKDGAMAVADETIQDTFRDIAVYAILGGLLLSIPTAPYQKREGQRSET